VSQKTRHKTIVETVSIAEPLQKGSIAVGLPIQPLPGRRKWRRGRKGEGVRKRGQEDMFFGRELFVLGQIENQEATKPGTNAYQQEDVVKKPKLEPHQQLQMEEPVHTNTVDADDGMYEYVADADLRAARSLAPKY